MTILHISDTHNQHHLLKDLPLADVIVHSGDFTMRGTEEEVLDFLNWFINLPYEYKIFVVGNHDICLWEAKGIEDLPENVYFLQDKEITINGVNFFGIGYDHPEDAIPDDTDILISHEPPIMILDEAGGTHWGNAMLRNRVFSIKPKCHLFGHAHGAYGIEEHNETTFSNAALLSNNYKLVEEPRIVNIP